MEEEGGRGEGMREGESERESEGEGARERGLCTYQHTVHKVRVV